jgi:hypothetical protein
VVRGPGGVLRSAPAGQPRSAVRHGGRRARQPRLVLGPGGGPLQRQGPVVAAGRGRTGPPGLGVWAGGRLARRLRSTARAGRGRTGPPGLGVWACCGLAGRQGRVVRGRCGRAGPPGLVMGAGGGPAGRLSSAVLRRYGCAWPRGASRCGLSGRGLPVLPVAAHAVRTTGPGLRTAGPRKPAGTRLGAAHRPVRAGARRGPRAIWRLAAARRWATAEPCTAGSRAAVARRGVGRPVRRFVAAPARLIRTPPCGLVRAAIGAAPRGLIRARNRRRTVP